MILLSVLVGESLLAQEYKCEVGGALGASYYTGDAVRRGPLGMYTLGAQAVGRYNINFRTALVTTLGYMGLRGDTRLADNSFPDGHKARFRTHSLAWTMGGEFNFLPLSNKFRYLNTSSWSPYMGGGALLAWAWGEGASVLVPGAYIALGVKYMLSSRVSLGAQWQWQYYLSDRLDALTRGSEWLANPMGLNRTAFKGGDASGTISLSLTYHVGLRNRSSCYTM